MPQGAMDSALGGRTLFVAMSKIHVSTLLTLWQQLDVAYPRRRRPAAEVVSERWTARS
jgi:hypothetical protein